MRDAGPPAIDLSKINFEALAQRFKDSTVKNTDLEALKAAIRAKLGTLLRLNRTRADYAEQFEALIESYSASSRSIEQLFDELLRGTPWTKTLAPSPWALPLSSSRKLRMRHHLSRMSAQCEISLLPLFS